MTTLIGESVTLTWAAPGAGLATLAVQRPDASPLDPPLTVASTEEGRFSAVFLPTMAGRHLITWQHGGSMHVDILDVWPPDPGYLISIDDALNAIRSKLPAARDAAREDIALYVAAATWVIENITGPILSREVEQTAPRYNGGAVLLPSPGEVVSVTVDSSSTPLDVGSYDVDEVAGIVYVDAPRGSRVTVRYRAGGPTIPANVRLAAREQVRFLWQVGHQGTRGNTAATETMPFTSEGFAVPRRVIELLQATPRTAGFA